MNIHTITITTATVSLSVLLLTASMLLAVTFPAHAEVDAPPAGKQIAIILTNHAELGDTGKATGFYLGEAAHPWAAFREVGYDVVFASPQGGLAPIDPSSMTDPDAESEAFLEALATEARTAVDTVAIDTLDASAIDAVFVAGGHGTMWDLPDNKALQHLIRDVYESEGVVAAVCHGPAALVNVQLTDGAYLVNGRQLTSFTNAEEAAVELTDTMPFLLEDKFESRGATFVPAANFSANVVSDDRLITGQNPASAGLAADAVIERLAAE